MWGMHVHLNGSAIRSCSIAINTIGDQEITTIEGFSKSSKKIEKIIKKAWLTHDVAQCGYCQPGQNYECHSTSQN